MRKWDKWKRTTTITTTRVVPWSLTDGHRQKWSNFLCTLRWSIPFLSVFNFNEDSVTIFNFQKTFFNIPSRKLSLKFSTRRWRRNNKIFYFPKFLEMASKRNKKRASWTSRPLSRSRPRPPFPWSLCISSSQPRTHSTSWKGRISLKRFFALSLSFFLSFSLLSEGFQLIE